MRMRLHDDCIRRRNPQASADLILSTQLSPTVSPEKAKSQLDENIRLDVPWMDAKEANSHRAFVCASAPSLNDYLYEISSTNATIFACNGAANVLSNAGIICDYQVLLEPHDCIINDFNDSARRHLISSVAPTELFRRSKNAILWHPMAEWIEKSLAGETRDFHYIGGAVSVTVYALSLAYTMGYRDIVLYGADSSYDGNRYYASGIAPCPGDVDIEVEEAGEVFRTTLGLKAQVEAILNIANSLEKGGCLLSVRGSGLLPKAFEGRRPVAGKPEPTNAASHSFGNPETKHADTH